MVILTKKRIEGIMFSLTPILAFFLIMAQISGYYEDRCLKEADALYSEQLEIYHNSRVALSNRNWYHILEVKKLIENDSDYKERYRENAHEQRDKANEYITNASEMGEKLDNKIYECRINSRDNGSWIKSAFFVIIFEVILGVIYFRRTK